MPLIVLAASCGRDTVSIPTKQWEAKVVGAVVNANGIRVPANVTLRMVLIGHPSTPAPLGRCLGDAVSPQVAKTDDEGKFSFTFPGTGPPIFVCISVAASAVPPMSGTGSTAVDSILIGSIALDEVQVIVKLDK